MTEEQRKVQEEANALLRSILQELKSLGERLNSIEGTISDKADDIRQTIKVY